jgi:DNA repair exonuclease SbcCD ATPase subunit
MPMNPSKQTNGQAGLSDELHQANQRLQDLAKRLQDTERELEVLKAKYEAIKDYAYAKLREEPGLQCPDPGEKDIETLIREEGGRPFDEWFPAFERLCEGR